MTVSYDNSKAVFEGIKGAGIKTISALPETWLGLLLQRAEDDPDIQLIQVAKEEEAIGVAAGAYFADERHVLLMQSTAFWQPSTASSPWPSSTACPCACSLRYAAIGVSRIRGTPGAESSRRKCFAPWESRSSTPGTPPKWDSRSGKHTRSRRAPSPPSRCS